MAGFPRPFYEFPDPPAGRQRPRPAGGPGERRRTAFPPEHPSGPRREGGALRILLLVAAVWAIYEVARWWDAMHPLRTASSPGGREAASGGPYLDWDILDRRRRGRTAPRPAARDGAGGGGSRAAFTGR